LGKKFRKLQGGIFLTHTVVVIKFVFILYIACLGLALLYLVIQHFCCQCVIKNSVQFRGIPIPQG